MAFTSREMDMLKAQIETLYNRRTALEKIPLSHDDIVEMFIYPEDRAPMQRAAGLLDTTYMDRSIRVLLKTNSFVPVHLTIRLANKTLEGKTTTLLPKYTQVDFVKSPTRIAAIEDLVCDHINLRIDYNYVKKLLVELNETCHHPSQVAFFWPVVRILVDMTKDERLIKKMETSTRAPLKALVPELRAACRETAEIITMAHMLGDVTAAKNWITIHTSVTSQHYRDTPIGTIRAFS